MRHFTYRFERNEIGAGNDKFIEGIVTGFCECGVVTIEGAYTRQFGTSTEFLERQESAAVYRKFCWLDEIALRMLQDDDALKSEILDHLTESAL